MSRRSRVTWAVVLATACSTGPFAFQPLALAAGSPVGQVARSAVTAPGSPGAAEALTGVLDLRQGTTAAQERARGGRSAALQASVPSHGARAGPGPAARLPVGRRPRPA